jgi:hypothetical protein
LLGSGDVEFGVLVYSKAASLLAMLAVYGMASKSNEDQLEQGPIPELLHHTPPGKVQVRDQAGRVSCCWAGADSMKHVSHCTGQVHVVHDKHQAEVWLKLLATGDEDQPAAALVQQAVPEDVVAAVADLLLLLLYFGVAL